MDKADIPPRASLVLLVACTGSHPIVSDAVLDEFARIGQALAPEKVQACPSGSEEQIILRPCCGELHPASKRSACCLMS